MPDFRIAHALHDLKYCWLHGLTSPAASRRDPHPAMVMNSTVHGARVNGIHIGVLVTLWAAVHILLYVYSGIGTEFFDSRGYIKAADYLIAPGKDKASQCQTTHTEI